MLLFILLGLLTELLWLLFSPHLWMREYSWSLLHLIDDILEVGLMIS